MELLLFLLIVIFLLQCCLFYLAIRTQSDMALLRILLQELLMPADAPEKIQEDVTVRAPQTPEGQPPSGELISSLKGYGNE